MSITTKRLFLKKWREEDFIPFAALNACRKVCEFLPKTLSSKESDGFANKIEDHFEQYGFGLFAIEIRDTGEFAGFTGLNTVNFQAHFTPAIEIGWRLAHKHWGIGIATEAAIAVREYASNNLELKDLVSFTTENNLASRRVMEKIGMLYDKKGDFGHPNLSDSSPLKRHVLYRISLT